jgi:hypothetical protein
MGGRSSDRGTKSHTTCDADQRTIRHANLVTDATPNRWLMLHAFGIRTRAML